jgi:hypothetical protein
MALRPLHDSFLFAFTNDTSRGRFIESNSFGLILTDNDFESQGKYARWGKVLAIGNDVVDFGVGDLVLIEHGMWTIGFDHDDVKIWKSDQKRVIAIGEDPSVVFAY